MDHDGGVVEPPGEAQRRANDQDREQLLRRGDDLGQRLLDLVEQRILQQQVLDRVGREAEFREDHDGRPCLVALGREPQRLGEVVGGVGDPRARNAASDPQEVV